MKIKFTLLLSFSLFIGIHFPSFSQTEQGSKMIGGSGYVLFQSPFSIGLFPNFGVFVVDNLAVGSGLQLHFSRDDFYSSTALGLNPFVRYYFGKSQTRVFTQGSVGYLRTWDRSFNQRDEIVSSSGSFRGFLDLGLSRFISNQIALEVAVNYTQVFDEDPYSRVRLNIGFQIFLPSSKE